MKIQVSTKIQRSNGFDLDVSFDCETQALGIVGPSGSGKSSLLDAIAGIEAGAKVILDGKDYSGLKLHERNFGYVTQDALLFPHLNVRENLLYSPRATSLEEIAKALHIENLLERMPRNLSGGEKKRVALARALLSKPSILLLDEPFAGLDEQRRREALSLLCEIRERYRIPMLLVSHLAEEVIGLTDWALRLEQGRLIESGASVSVLRAGETRIDNYFSGEVTEEGLVRVGSLELTALLPPDAKGKVRLACYAHDILLATVIPAGLSARNAFWTQIASLSPIGNAILVQLESPSLRVLITEQAKETMNLKIGSKVAALIKATSLAYLGQG